MLWDIIVDTGILVVLLILTFVMIGISKNVSYILHKIVANGQSLESLHYIRDYQSSILCNLERIAPRIKSILDAVLAADTRLTMIHKKLSEKPKVPDIRLETPEGLSPEETKKLAEEIMKKASNFGYDVVKTEKEES